MSDGGIGPFTRDQLVGAAYTAMRIVFGALFAVHGAQKLFGAFGGQAVELGTQLGIGAIIELVGGALIAVGLFTRPAAFISAGQMAVAYLQFHWRFAVADHAWLPQVNKGEAAVLYCFAFLVMAAYGGGAWSLDRSLRGTR